MADLNGYYQYDSNASNTISITSDLYNSGYITSTLANLEWHMNEHRDITHGLIGRLDVAQDSIKAQMNDVNDDIVLLRNEIQDLKKIIARLSTRVNALIAEKQVKEYAENNI